MFPFGMQLLSRGKSGTAVVRDRPRYMTLHARGSLKQVTSCVLFACLFWKASLSWLWKVEVGMHVPMYASGIVYGEGCGLSENSELANRTWDSKRRR